MYNKYDNHNTTASMISITLLVSKIYFVNQRLTMTRRYLCK